jgi:cytosine/adenosine deaminase-related metal-dependent hydrolase
MDDARREIRGGGVFARDGVIESVGPTAELPQSADQVLDLDGYLVLPGLVNCHHHLYQTLTRAVPGTQDAVLFDWLRTLYPIWARLTPEAMYTSSLVGMAELILSGCTTASDHHYIFPNGCKLDDQIRAAREIGIRFHASRGSMSLGESKGGLPPDRCVEDESAILKETERLIQAYHDPRPYAMMRIVVAPCSPFSVTPELMRESAALARAYNVRLHTHLAETHDEEVFCLERFGRRPVDYAADLDWAGPDVWYAHVVHVNPSEIERLAACGSGVAHCPSSNMRLASGIAPIKAMVAAGVKVGLGVDGSASNDGSHLLGEARQAMLLQRVLGDPCALTARQALELGTRGGAAVLGRDDIGALQPGRAADLIALRLNRLPYAGALHDALAAAVFCAPQGVDYSVINGRVIVDQGHLTTIDLGPVVERHNRISLQMIQGH